MAHAAGEEGHTAEVAKIGGWGKSARRLGVSWGGRRHGMAESGREVGGFQRGVGERERKRGGEQIRKMGRKHRFVCYILIDVEIR